MTKLNWKSRVISHVVTWPVNVKRMEKTLLLSSNPIFHNIPSAWWEKRTFDRFSLSLVFSTRGDENKSFYTYNAISYWKSFLIQANTKQEIKKILTWFPKTPMLHADETWLGPNQTAASFAGRERIKTWLAATIDCPMKAT